MSAMRRSRARAAAIAESGSTVDIQTPL